LCLEDTALNGRLHLAFEKTSNGGTVLHLRRQEPPWRVLRAFGCATGQALVHLNNTSGGILGGDCLEMRADLSRGARVQITTTGATRVYRPRADAAPDFPARTNAHFELAEDSLLELLPDALIPYAGSRFAQSTTVNLAQGATLFWWEVLAPGREASGEIFAFEQLRMETEIRTGGVPIAIDRMHLDPRTRPLESPARLGSCRHLATLYVCRAGEASATWSRLQEQLWGEFNSQTRVCMDSQDGVIWGISSLTCDGLVIRGMARRGAALVTGLREFWRAARLLLTGEPATLPRKVY
jgi:urease accessory protein